MVIIELTVDELDEIISCVDAARYAGMAYGMVTEREFIAAEEYRQKLLDKLNAITERE